jgi:hypothetical protein
LDGEDLTDWEEEFLADILVRALEGHDLTDGQMEKLEQIEWKVSDPEEYWAAWRESNGG